MSRMIQTMKSFLHTIAATSIIAATLQPSIAAADWYLTKNSLICSSEAALDTQMKYLAQGVMKFSDGCGASKAEFRVVMLDYNVISATKAKIVENGLTIYAPKESFENRQETAKGANSNNPQGGHAEHESMPSSANAAGFSTEDICKAAIAVEMGREVSTMKTVTAGPEPEITYKRKADGKKFSYRCTLDGNRVVWKTFLTDEKQWGRWRNGEYDSVITYAIQGDKLHIEDTQASPKDFSPSDFKK